MKQVLIYCLLLLFIACKGETSSLENNNDLLIYESKETVVTNDINKVQKQDKTELKKKTFAQRKVPSSVNEVIEKSNNPVNKGQIGSKIIQSDEKPKTTIHLIDEQSNSKNKREEKEIENEKRLSVKKPILINKSNAGAQSHNSWDELLQQFVKKNGNVNYKGLKEHETELDKYLDLLKHNAPNSSWSDNKIKAYWINAYNSNTIKMILNNWPLNSVMDISSGKAWDDKWIAIGGKLLSLNNIEHDILRKKFNDARIHFAVNCAAKSCPPLWNKAWTEDNIEKSLDKRTTAFINNTNYNQLSDMALNLSKIFEWYTSDFDDLITFLNKYANININKKAQLNYNEYNWALNQ